MYLGNTINATENDLINVTVEEKKCILGKNSLHKGVNFLQYILR
jgi:hypothetical protein